MEQLVSNLFRAYLSCGDFAESTVAIKQRAVRFFVKAFGDMDIKDVDYSHAEDFRNWLTKGRNKTTANIYTQNFKPFWSWLVKRGYITANPFSTVKRFVVDEQRCQVFSSEEIERLLLVSNLRWKTMILLGLSSMRRSEILNIVVDDIYFDRNYILIASKKDTKQTWRWGTKNHKKSIVPLPETIKLPHIEVNLHEFLKEQIETLPTKQPYVFVQPHYYQKLMALKSNGGIDWELRNNPSGNFSRQFLAIQKRAKIPPRRFHDLRATFATNMAQHMSLVEVQKLMRHSSPQTTAKYYVEVNQQDLAVKANGICSECYSKALSGDAGNTEPATE